MAWTSPSTWVAGAVLTAAQLNQQLRDNLKAIGDPWTTFTTTWGGTIGNGTITSVALTAGKLTHFRIEITAGSTTNFTGGSALTAPSARAGGRGVLTGVARIGGNSYPVYGDVSSGSMNITLRVLPTTAGNALVNVSSTVPATFGTGDTLSISGAYEAA